MMISCTELDGFIVDYLDGQLPQLQRLRFEVHLDTCTECREYLLKYRQSIALLQNACGESQAAECEDIPEALVSAIMGAHCKIV